MRLISHKISNLFLQTSLKRYSTRNVAEPSYFHYIGKSPLVYRTIGQQLEKSANEFPAQEAFVSTHEGKRLTFGQLLKQADELAAGFAKLGLQRGDRIGLWAPNLTSWYLSYFAAARAGLVSVGINPAYQPSELEYCLNKVGVKAIIAPEAHRKQRFYEVLDKVIPEMKESPKGQIKSNRVPSLQSVIIDSPNRFAGTLPFEEIFSHDKDCLQKIQESQHLTQPDSACNIQFTSGTTGHPKATVLSHFSFVNNAIHVGNRNELAGERICVQVPLFHAYGILISVMAALCHGATMVLPDAGFNPEKSLRAIVDEKCSVIHGTPTMYVDLISKQNELKLPLKAKYAVTGGSPCSPHLFKNIKDVLGLQKVKTVFGMTETTAVIFQSLYEETEQHILETVGHVQDHIEAKVVDENGETVPFGMPGELCVRGYLNMLCYFGDEAKTKETISNDRWLKTGDQFILQKDGYGRIVGRLKEMIIRGGENIFPKEVEDFLNTHPDIIETHVIGIPDERMGEEVCAFVRLRKGANSIKQKDVKEFCSGKIAHFKIPRYVETIDDFPKTTSGKIQKFKLNEIFESRNK